MTPPLKYLTLLAALIVSSIAPSAISVPVDSSVILGHIVAHHEKSFAGFQGYRLVGDRLLVQAAPAETGEVMRREVRTFHIVDPLTLEILWSVTNRWSCYPTCERCATPCIACETQTRPNQIDTVDVFDLEGDLIHCKDFDSEALSVGAFPATRSSPHGDFFYVGWSSSYFNFPVFDRSGQLIFNSATPRNVANEAYAFSDSVILIPVLESVDPMSARPLLQVYHVPNSEPQDTIEIPSPGMMVAQLRVALPPDGEAAAIYSYYGTMIAYIGRDLTLGWTAQPFEQVHHVAFSIDGRFLAIIGCPAKDYQEHSPALILAASESGQTLWRVDLGSEESGTRSYFAGPMICIQGRKATEMIVIDSVGSLIHQERIPGVVDVLRTEHGYVTVSRGDGDESLLISNEWLQ